MTFRPTFSPGIGTITVVALIVRVLLASFFSGFSADETQGLSVLTGGLATDEANGVMIAVSGSWADMLENLKQDGNAPVFYALVRYFDSKFGHTEIAVKILAVIIATLQIPVAYGLFRLVLPRYICLQLAWILTFCPSMVRYGVLVRPYALVTLISLVSSMLCIKILTRGSTRIWSIPYGISTALIVYTHYWGAFVAIGQAGLALIGLARKWFDRREFVNWLIGVGISLLIFAPQLPTLLYQLKHDLSPWDNIARPMGLIAWFIPGTMLDIGGRVTWVDQISLVICNILVIAALVSASTFLREDDEVDETSTQDDEQSATVFDAPATTNDTTDDATATTGREGATESDTAGDATSTASDAAITAEPDSAITNDTAYDAGSTATADEARLSSLLEVSKAVPESSADSLPSEEKPLQVAEDSPEVADDYLEPSFDTKKWKTLVLCGLAGCFLINFFLPSMRFRYMQPFVPMIIVLSLTGADMFFRHKGKLLRYTAVCALWIAISLPQLQFISSLPETNTPAIVDHVKKNIDTEKDLVVISWQVIAPAITFDLPKDVPSIAYPDLKRSDYNYWPEMTERVRAPGKLPVLVQKMQETLDKGGKIWLIERARDITSADYSSDTPLARASFEETCNKRMDQIHSWLKDNAHASAPIKYAPGRDFGIFLSEFQKGAPVKTDIPSPAAAPSIAPAPANGSYLHTPGEVNRN